MPDHPQERSPVFLGECKILGRKLAHHIAVERVQGRGAEAKEDREQWRGVFEGFSESLCSLNVRPCLSKSRLRVGCCIAFDNHQCVCEGYLQLDLLPTKR